MLYEKYYRKTLKWSSILTVIHRFRVLIICALLAVIAMIAAFMALFGMVYSSGECPSEITYGENLDYEAKSLFTRVSYEYCSSDGEWTSSFPRQVGEYSVRSVSKNIFGSPRYGEVYSFAILPKETEVYVGVSSVEYGEMPAVTADLAYEDSLQCTSVIYDDVTKTSTGVIPNKSCVAIINKSGSDVTSNYNITCVKTDISFTRRTLTVEVEGAEKVYDGMALTCSSYSITGGTLADGDSITAEVNSSITDVGSVENSLVFTVVNKNGKDVTSHYYIQVNASMLTVTQRTLYITTGDYTYTYDGTEHSYQNYEAQSGVTDEGLLVTHKLSATELTYATDAGTYENIIGFTITDRSGNDVTANYNIVSTYGTLTVAPRPITITTGTSQKVYDGTPLYNTDYTLTYGSIANGQAADIVYYAEQTDAGSTENVVTLSISSGQSDVTANYLITYVNGILTVTQREVTVITGSAEKVYDATPLTCEDCSCTNIAEGQTAHIASQSSITDVGSVQNITNTAYITDENGIDVTANYIITYEYGTLTVTPRPVTVVAGSSYKVYDATPLTCTEIGYYNLVSWHTATAQTYGSQTNVGSSENIIVEGSVVIYDENGSDVTYNYDISLASGTLTVTPRPITATAGSAQKVYDATPLECADVYYDNLVEGHTATALTYGSQTDVGTSLNNVVVNTVVILDESGNDVTYNYSISYETGELTVTPRPVTFVTATAEWVYNDEEYYCKDFEVSAESEYPLVSWHTASVADYPSITDVGSIQNTLVIEIYDGVNDVTYNYDISYIYGTLTVTPRPITITTGSDKKLYDGTPLTCNSFEVENVVAGHITEVFISGSQTEVGSSDNTVEAAYIYNSSWADVTYNYEITYVYGTLTVAALAVTLTTYSQEWLYEGLSHSAEGCVITGGGLAEGQFVIMSVSSITNVGSAENVGTATIYDSEYNDVTANYYITYEYGTITVFSPLELSRSASYDFTAESAGDYTFTLESGRAQFYVNNKLSETLSQSGGTVTLTLSAGDVVTIKAVYASVITAQYVFDEEGGEGGSGGSGSEEGGSGSGEGGSGSGEGGSGSGEGGSGSGEGGSGSGEGGSGSGEGGSGFGEGGSGSGEGGSGSGEGGSGSGEGGSGSGEGGSGSGEGGSGSGEGGSGSEEGGDDQGGDDSGGDSGDFGNLDTSGNISGGDLTAAGDNAYMLITSDTTGSLYLKLMNFGDYNGSGWEEATEYDGYITVDGTEYSLSYLFSLALDEACYTASEVTVELYVDDYVLPYYLDFYGGDYEIQTSDVSYSGSTTTYTVNVYYYDYLTYVAAGLTLPEAYTELELAYRTFVYENYLSVPQSTAEYLNTVIQEQGFDADDENIVSKVVNYIQNAATYNLAYDSALDEEEDIVVAFLRDYKEGICQHYASAATLLFRTLGIPARYVLGYYAVTSAGQSVETGAPHAWTEIYIDGLGWVQLEVTGSSDGSGDGGSGGGGGANMELLQEIITIKIKPVDAVQTYDGSSLTASAVEGTSDNYTYMLRELLYLGYTYTVQFGGSQTELGTGVSYITSFVLYNPDGTVHDDSGYTYYIFEFSEGTLTVTDVPVVTVYLYDISKVYDGTAISYEDTDYYWLEDEYEVVVEGLSNISLTNYGIANKKMLNKLTVTVYDLYGNDVTDSVYVNIDRTDLLIVYRKCITITTASASKVYDGEPLTDETWWLSFGSIVEGQSLEVTVTGSITEVGFTFNFYDAVIYGANGATVTNNYLITYNVGILSVEEE